MKKYLKKSFAVLTCTTMCIQTTMAILAEKIPGSDTSQQISIQALTTGQWKKDSTGWWYQNADGSYPKKQWKMINEQWYHLDSNGYMQTGWLTLNGIWYYLKSGGEMATGWEKISGAWYYLGDSGAMATGWQKIGSTWYYLRSDGSMMENQWAQISGNWYYFTSGGAMQHDTWIEDYYVDSNGVWQQNYRPAQWIEEKNGKRWYRRKDGSYPANEWMLLDAGNRDWWYYFDGSGYMVTGWKKIGGAWYYFRENREKLYGAMCLDGMFQINGTYYSFAADGKMQTGWVAHGLWYYFDPDTGAPAKGWKELNHTMYYFDESNGYMVTGRRTIDDEEYCFNSDGSMHTGWYKEINKWADDNSDCIDFLYFDPDGKLHKKWLTVDGKTYWTGDYGYVAKSYPDRYESIAFRKIDRYLYGFDENGVMLTGYQQSVDKRTGKTADYFFDEQGRQDPDHTGWIEIDGQQHYMSHGFMLVSTRYKIDGVIYNFDENGVATAEKH